ncbi:hypothetical protein SAMN05444515_105108 [Ectothiorhodospira marina]|uniref:Uncharacterized protein n=1 Tax=Ectothiorhodospira marina TaxID=1396821 RepID=A0A1H7K2S3_9GAMM|nr:hypothetical protein SAMN05444515_105108 [Ectothiorhodospira marina]
MGGIGPWLGDTYDQEEKHPDLQKASTRSPMADKLIKKMRSHVGAKVVDLSAVMEGKKNAQALKADR